MLWSIFFFLAVMAKADDAKAPPPPSLPPPQMPAPHSRNTERYSAEPRDAGTLANDSDEALPRVAHQMFIEDDRRIKWFSFQADADIDQAKKVATLATTDLKTLEGELSKRLHTRLVSAVANSGMSEADVEILISDQTTKLREAKRKEDLARLRLNEVQNNIRYNQQGKQRALKGVSQFQTQAQKNDYLKQVDLEINDRVKEEAKLQEKIHTAHADNRAAWDALDKLKLSYDEISGLVVLIDDKGEASARLNGGKLRGNSPTFVGWSGLINHISP